MAIQNALVLSGGGSKGAFTAGVIEWLLRNRDEPQDFDFAVGTSTGALVGGPALLGEHPYLRAVYTSVNNGHIFQNTLLGRLFGMPIDADMGPLHEMLKDYYLPNGLSPEGAMQRLLDSGKEFAVAIVRVKTGMVHLLSTSEISANRIKPETMVRAILASCCEPVFTEPVRVFEEEGNDSPYAALRDDLFYDGGVKEFLPLEHAIQRKARKIWLVSTHPLHYKEAGWGDQRTPDNVSLTDAVGWTLSSFLDEVARGDRFRADAYYHLGRGMDHLRTRLVGNGLDSIAVDETIDEVVQLVSQGRVLDKFYVIRPDDHLPTSLEFQPALMQEYYSQGTDKAKAFLRLSEDQRAYRDETQDPWPHYAP